MQFTAASALTLLAAAASAAPLAVSKMADNTSWTIEGFSRACNSQDTSCTVKFAIDAGAGAPATPCTYKTAGARAPVSGVTCGDYTVSSSWSGQFGEGQGFTTLALVDAKNRLIAWPAYTDKQLANGTAVTPDQSYTPARLG